MALKIGTTDATAVYVGTTAVSKVYLGTTEIWPLISSSPVTFGAAGTPAQSGGNANTLTTANAPITIGSEANRMLLVHVSTSHANNYSWTTFPTFWCNSSVSGNLTQLTAASSSVQGSNEGDGHLFYLLNPPTGTHNITARFQLPAGAWGDRIRVTPYYLYNVNQTTPFGTPNVTAVNSTVNNTLSSTSANSLAVFGYVGMNQLAGFNQTEYANYGGTVNGTGDWMQAGGAGGGSSVSFTSTNSNRHMSYAVEVLPA